MCKAEHWFLIVLAYPSGMPKAAEHSVYLVPTRVPCSTLDQLQEETRLLYLSITVEARRVKADAKRHKATKLSPRRR